ncbi:hypothetical protein [Legionella brunensis]|uniref:Ornithine carbamoyltransferase n=1 Tax=Legionella brunensis TaxID=29422 RepID=A0A0W0SP54_9GAMM|nr:hypothetical protein [Legionella brunensis]KTC85144.1 ornithine carbamoyltransferase [Legionella brunensis]
MAKAKPEALFMHCMPMEHGKEVSVSLPDILLQYYSLKVRIDYMHKKHFYLFLQEKWVSKNLQCIRESLYF